MEVRITNAQKIKPFLWFDGVAEDAAALYTAMFPRSRVVSVSRYGKEGFEIHGQPEGRAMVVDMELAGYRIAGLNGGPEFKITPAISFFVQLETEAEVDALWAGLVEDGSVLMPLAAYDSERPVRRVLADFVRPPGRRRPGDLPITAVRRRAMWQGRGGAGTLHFGLPELACRRHPALETFMVMDSAQRHEFGFNEGVSLMIACATQAEVDHYWNALIADGGSESVCGWLKDRFGVSWQVVPEVLPRLLSGSDKGASGRVMTAIHGMRKLDIAALEAAGASKAEAAVGGA